MQPTLHVDGVIVSAGQDELGARYQRVDVLRHLAVFHVGVHPRETKVAIFRSRFLFTTRFAGLRSRWITPAE